MSECEKRKERNFVYFIIVRGYLPALYTISIIVVVIYTYIYIGVFFYK